MRGLRGCGPILIAEDDKNIATLLSKYLQRDGFATRIALDGSDALQQVAAQSPSLVILDLMLPTVDGWEVCSRIRDSSEVPIMMLTALEQEADRIRGFSLGADDYVVKPFSPREVVERVKAICGAAQPARQRNSGHLAAVRFRCNPTNMKFALPTSRFRSPRRNIRCCLR